MPINWSVTPEEHDLIRLIVDRMEASRLWQFAGYARLDAQMDITAVHANGCPLDLAGLVDAEEYDFMHDVAGINRHLNRETGRLLGAFLPRYAKREEVAS